MAKPSSIPRGHAHLAQGPLPPVILPRSVNLLAGAPGNGKSAFLTWFIRKLSLRESVLGLTPNLVPFQGLITADRSWLDSTRIWFELAGLLDFPCYSLQDDDGFSLAKLRRRADRVGILEMALLKLEAQAPQRKFPQGSVIYVDPIAPFLGGDLNNYDACLVACTEIRRLCRRRGLVMVGTAHAGKQAGDAKQRYLRLQDRILGSTALFGYTDTQMYLASPEETGGQDHVFLWAPHHAPTQLFAFGRDAQGLFVPKGEIDRDTDQLPFVQAVFPEPGVEISTEDIIARAQAALSIKRARAFACLRSAVEGGVVVKVRQGIYLRPKPS